ncbi:6,7-dimethyl-8-ribityllumazine synthase [Rhodococcus erythropolis]|nr:6,7-dimethyl-8-ribityllumazine synthase [Rhodococcus erythropolis]
MKSSQGRIALIQAAWHHNIVDRARKGFLDEVTTLGYSEENVECFEVPGAFEIPLHAQWLAGSGRYDAVVAAALVVDGGIYRHEFVSAAVIDGLMRVQLDTGVPVFSIVLTPHHFHEHADHITYFTKHFERKGAEAAKACTATLATLRTLPD